MGNENRWYFAQGEREKIGGSDESGILECKGYV